jgi:outer membrane protein OmpA-like peptidoglycan-associated protein
MKKIFLVGIALVIGTAAWGAEKDLLTPEPERITDEAIADDINVIQALQGRLATLDNKGVPIDGYHFAKAQAWLDFAMDEYTINDRSRVVEEALWQARGIIEQLEAGENEISMDTSIIPTSTKVRADLWEKAEAMKNNSDSFRCAGDKIAQLEVQLVWAGHEEQGLGWRHAKPYLQAAERLAREADAQMAACPPRRAESAVIAAQTDLPGEVPVPLPAAMKCPEPAPAAVSKVLEPLPDRVHFALNRAKISAASAAVLNRIAAAMKSEPILRVVLQGHADQRGEFTYNIRLSQRRANSVRSYLVNAGIAGERISVIALGKSKPLIPAETIDGYARNRRVEFAFTSCESPLLINQRDDLQPEQSR